MGADRHGSTAVQTVKQAGPDIAAGAIAELIAHALGVGPAASTLAPALGATIRTLQEADKRQWQQVAQAIAVAADELGDDIYIEVAALSNLGNTELFRRVVQAAGRTTLEEKIPALGRVLAQGLGNAARLDGALMLAAAIADLDAAHVLVLDTIASTEPHLDELGHEQRDWGVMELADHIEPYKYLMISIISTLERHALVADNGENATGGRRMLLTEIGGQCLTFLKGPGTRSECGG